MRLRLALLREKEREREHSIRKIDKGKNQQQQNELIKLDKLVG